VLETYYGWEPKDGQPLRRYGVQGRYGWGELRPIDPVDESKGNYKGQLVNPWGWNFSRSAIGERRYMCTMAALSRACRRLQRRGLVTISPWVDLTDEGWKWLSVKPTLRGR
jgi:hypothetical protein